SHVAAVGVGAGRGAGLGPAHAADRAGGVVSEAVVDDVRAGHVNEGVGLVDDDGSGAGGRVVVGIAGEGGGHREGAGVNRIGDDRAEGRRVGEGGGAEGGAAEGA